jgi:tyrosyl-tRNA synthetase
MKPEPVDPAVEREAARQLELLLRGVVDCVQRDELEKRLRRSIASGKPLRVKLGFDPTSTDLHLGHAVVLRKLRQFQELGHHAVFIVGGATAQLGDPSGKDKTRPQLTREQVAANAQTYLDQAFKVVRRDETWSEARRAGAIEVVDNSSWFSSFGFADFVRLASKTTVARMTERDNFAKRLKEGAPIGLHELLYPLLQGHDSVEVRADVELGGTDQLFNLLVGRDLQVDAGQAPQVCMTTAILPGLDGTHKMSKSLGNYVGLTFSADDVFGKVMSLPDAQMATWFELLTEEWRDAAARARTETTIRERPRDAKVALATTITTWLHDAAAAAAAHARFDRVFRDKDLSADAPLVHVPKAEVPTGKLWVVALLVKLEFAATNGEARRLVQGRGVKLDGVVVEDEKLEVDLGREVLVQAGKRRFARVVLAG